MNIRAYCQLRMDSVDSQCIHIHNSTEHYMRVLDCLQAGYKTCVVIANYTDVIVALMFRGQTLSERDWGNCRYGRGEAPPPVLRPFTLYVQGWVMTTYAQTFQHYIASQAVISPAIWVPRKRLSRLKNDPLARIWHNDYTNLCNSSTGRTVLGEWCRCWEQVQQFPRTSRTSISLFQINLT